jgi:hypothetical protein
MALALVGGLALAGDWAAMSGVTRVGALAALVVGGAAVYFGACFALGLRVRELRMQELS